jgi:hypothetical protein
MSLCCLQNSHEDIMTMFYSIIISKFITNFNKSKMTTVSLWNNCIYSTDGIDRSPSAGIDRAHAISCFLIDLDFINCLPQLKFLFGQSSTTAQYVYLRRVVISAIIAGACAQRIYSLVAFVRSLTHSTSSTSFCKVWQCWNRFGVSNSAYIDVTSRIICRITNST